MCVDPEPLKSVKLVTKIEPMSTPKTKMKTPRGRALRPSRMPDHPEGAQSDRIPRKHGDKNLETQTTSMPCASLKPRDKNQRDKNQRDENQVMPDSIDSESRNPLTGGVQPLPVVQ